MRTALILGALLIVGCGERTERLSAAQCEQRAETLTKLFQSEEESAKRFPGYIGSDQWQQSRRGDDQLRAIHAHYCGKYLN